MTVIYIRGGSVEAQKKIALEYLAKTELGPDVTVVVERAVASAETR